MCFEGLARLSRRVWRHFVRGSREISLAPSLHRDALIHDKELIDAILTTANNDEGDDLAESVSTIQKGATKISVPKFCATRWSFPGYIPCLHS